MPRVSEETGSNATHERVDLGQDIEEDEEAKFETPQGKVSQVVSTATQTFVDSERIKIDYGRTNRLLALAAASKGGAEPASSGMELSKVHDSWSGI